MRVFFFFFFWSEGLKDGYTGNKDSTAFIMSRFREVDTGGNGIVFAWQMESLSLYRNEIGRAHV